MLVVVDTGGTKTLVSSFDKSGKLGAQIKFPTPKDEKEYIKLLRSTLAETYLDKSVSAIIIATPGVIKNGVVMWGGGNLKWHHFDLSLIHI